MSEFGGLAAEAYRARLSLRAQQAAKCNRQHVLLGYLRLALAAAAIVLAWLGWFRHELSGWWVLMPCAGFVVVARIHGRVLRHRVGVRRAIRFYELGLARLEDRWSELPAREPRIDVSSSLYAGDLDLFGRGGLFDRLSTARTSVGEDALAQWLLEPATPAEILARQTAVSELRESFDLREALAACDGPDVAALDRQALVQWGRAEWKTVPQWMRWIAPVLVLLTVFGMVRWAAGGSPLLFVVVLVVDATLTYTLHKKLDALFAAAERAADSLHLTAELIARWETEGFEENWLSERRSAFGGENGSASGRPSASRALARLAQLAELMAHRRNYMVRILDAPLLYSVQLAGAVQAWLRTHGGQVESWLRALGELEALTSFATYSYEHPRDPFAELVEDEVCFEARSMGHPLIAATRCVRNDVALSGGTKLLLLSGSNMSGKSTLLRGVGVNAVLAMAGAPVRAASLRLTPLRLGASIQVNDSLQEGRSRFYAEILRLRAICALAEQRPPVLFLLDELLDGTNSHDRLQGATGIANALMASGAIGLISTHDLALTAMSVDRDGSLRNVHFEDSIQNGEIRFDFRLREGAVETSNGVALMRMVGLKI